MPDRPVAVIGAGPIGLAAAAELTLRDQSVVVLEAGDAPGWGVRSWSHVRLFSPWSEVVSPAAASLLSEHGWRHPEPTAYPTGAAWVRDYLHPLAEVLGDQVRTGTQVVGVARRDRDLGVDSGRSDQPFVLHLRSTDGHTQRLPAHAVIDASGTVGRPSPLGAEGYPAEHEERLRARIRYGMPDAATETARYAGRTTVVVGSGASALTALIALTRAPLHTPDSRVVWVLRRGRIGSSLGGGAADQLPERCALGQRVAQGVAEGQIEVVTGFRTVALREHAGGIELASADGAVISGVDEVVAATGYRPELSFLSEVRLDLDERLQAPRALAPSIDPNVHACGSVAPHGHAVLEQPEGGLYLAGMKSYGRAPSFLALTGHEQVRSIAAALAGDFEGAAAVQLSLPDTGVCGGSGLFDDAPAGADSCCATAAPAPLRLPLRRQDGSS